MDMPSGAYASKRERKQQGRWCLATRSVQTCGVSFVLAALLLGSLGPSNAVSAQPPAAEHESWLSKVKVDPAAVDLLPAAMREKGVIVDGLNAAFAPFEYFDDDGKTIIGLDVDLATALAKTLNLKLDIVHASFATLIPGLTSGRYDILFSSFGDTAEREKVMDFVNYRSTGTYLITKSGNPAGLKSKELCGRKIAVVGGSTQVDIVVPVLDKRCAADGKPALDIVSFPESSDAPAAVNSGRAEGALIPSPQALYLVSVRPNVFDIPDAEQIGQSYSGITVPKGSPLAASLEKALNSLIESGAYGEIMAKWKMTQLSVPRAIINAAPAVQ